MKRNAAGGLRPAGIGIVLTLLLVAPAAAQVRATGGVLPDCEGAIAEVLVHFDPDNEMQIAPVFEDLFPALADDVRIIVACPTPGSARSFQRQWGALAVGRGRTVSIVNVGRPISLWARDRYIARQPASLIGSAPGFVPSAAPFYHDYQLNELTLPPLMTEARLAPSLLHFPIHLEGGNVVANRRHVFVGSNVFVENATEIMPFLLENKLRVLFGRDYVVLGHPSGDVPWCHVDMYMTPVDDRTVLVADPRLTDELLGLPCETENADAWSDDVDLSALLCVSDELQQRFDEVAQTLRSHNYAVIPLPAVVDEPEGWMITYNNVLMEERDGQRIVYMPVYGIPHLDAAAADIYHGLGFDVHPVDVSALYPSGGALRCVVNVTQRRRANLPAARTRSANRIRFIDLDRIARRRTPRATPPRASRGLIRQPS